MNKKISLNSFVFCCLLGDATVNRYGALTIEHSLKQKDYVFWKHEILRSYGVLTLKSTPTLVSRIHPRNKKEYQSLRFNTKSMFQVEREMFYSAGKKRLPDSFEKDCLIESIAIWYMDDGGRGGNSPLGMVIDVSAYSNEEVERICTHFQNSWNIHTSLHSQKNYGSAKKLYVR